MSLKNMKLRLKLLLSYSVLALLIVITVVIGLMMVNGIKGQFDGYANQNYQVTAALNQIETEYEALEKNMYAALLYADNDSKKVECRDGISSAFSAIRTQFTIVQEKFTGGTNYTTAFQQNLDKIEQLVAQAEQPGADALKVAESDVFPLVEEGKSVLEEMLTYSATRGDGLIEEMNESINIIMFVFLGVMVVAVAVTIILGIRVTKSIIVPIREMENVAHEMSQGNMKVQVNYQSGNEIGEMAETLRDTVTTLDSYVSDISGAMQMVANGDLTPEPTADFRGDFIIIVRSIQQAINSFDKALSQISLAANQVTSGSEQVSAGAQALSQGATEQASSVQQLAATINEISSQVNDNAANARMASEKVNVLGAEMMKGNEEMREMINAMDEINKSSSEISKIIKTIEDIAFQTNILALNAAVEAARAGAAGKGFAVVAEEVRNLASRSAEASKNTSSLIENSLRAVNHGSEIADRTAKSMVTIVEGAQEVTETINKISDASSQQAEAITQITVGVDQISAVVQTNSATAEQSAAASEELSSQAQLLKKLVSGFKLKGEVGNDISFSSAGNQQSFSDDGMASYDDDFSGVGAGKY